RLLDYRPRQRQRNYRGAHHHRIHEEQRRSAHTENNSREARRQEVHRSGNIGGADVREARRQRVQEVMSWRVWRTASLRWLANPTLEANPDREVGGSTQATCVAGSPKHQPAYAGRSPYFAENTRSIRVTFPCLSFTLTVNLPRATLSG